VWFVDMYTVICNMFCGGAQNEVTLKKKDFLMTVIVVLYII
jgi:hypothetical protein